MTLRPLLATAVAFALSGCTLHSSAKVWNGVVGPDGVPVYVHTTTNVGMNLGIFLEALGNTELESCIDTMTAAIRDEDGDHVRLVETSGLNLWFVFPPMSFLFTPVVTTTTAEYRPGL